MKTNRKAGNVFIALLSFVLIVACLFIALGYRSSKNLYLTSRTAKKLNEENKSKTRKDSNALTGEIIFGNGIKYQIMQFSDNEFYLSHDINNKYDIRGSVFLDYQNNKDYSDRSIIIYGHNMADGTMFGFFRECVSGNRINIKDLNFKIITCNNKILRCEILNIKIADAAEEIDLYKIYKSDSSHQEFDTWKAKINKNCIYNNNLTKDRIKNIEKIILLSTCLNNTTERIVICGYVTNEEKNKE